MDNMGRRRIFDSPNDDWNNTKIMSSGEFKNKPDGWETTSKTQDDNVWEMTQREEDILLQEFDRRIAYSKFQVCVLRSTQLKSSYPLLMLSYSYR